MAAQVRTLSDAAAMVRDASRITVLTGAGVSTDSGIPDFRGPRGIWTLDPAAERMSSLSWYLTDPEVRRRAWRSRLESPARTALPNATHLALAALGAQGRLRGLVTTNTDGLHQLAGSEPVIELHGTARRWQCEDCAAGGPLEDQLARVLAGDPDPDCPACGGITRADTILFGEDLDPVVIAAALEAASDCDLFLAAGTTLSVHPAAALLPLALRSGAATMIVNDEPTDLDDLATAVLTGSTQQLVPALLARQWPS